LNTALQSASVHTEGVCAVQPGIGSTDSRFLEGDLGFDGYPRASCRASAISAGGDDRLHAQRLHLAVLRTLMPPCQGSPMTLFRGQL
jgi:hypothetical protein